jgi:alcohol dehydrogenase, propanol-preferring
MKAMRLTAPRSPLELTEVTLPPLKPAEVRLRCLACGVCRTDLHLLDDELPDIPHPVTPGHEIVGTVLETGSAVTGLHLGQRVGVPWLGHTDGVCRYCRSGHENLCEQARFTGYTRDGGYAQEAVADARFCLPLPEDVPAAQLAPLLCAGLIGYRSYRAAGDAQTLGFYGFGAAAHLLAQLAQADGRRVLAFTRPGDRPAQDFARSLGAVWAGGSDEPSPECLDAAIIFAAVGSLVPAALAAVRPGGRVVCAGIHMSDIPSFPYKLLWGERSIASVANLTRADGEQFLARAAQIGLRATVETFSLAEANTALMRLRNGQLQGAAVLVP